MISNMEPHLRATPTIEADHGDIIETATRLTHGCSSDQQKAVKLFYFVRDTIRYNIYMVSVMEKVTRSCPKEI